MSRSKFTVLKKLEILDKLEHLDTSLVTLSRKYEISE